jgi:hypothetical protein
MILNPCGAPAGIPRYRIPKCARDLLVDIYIYDLINNSGRFGLDL